MAPATYGEEEKCIVLVVIPEGQRTLGGPRIRAEHTIKWNLKTDRRAWIGLIWLRIRKSGGLLWKR
jgi:hypothetical protein